MNEFVFDENDLREKRKNDIYLSNNEVNILEKNNINYNDFDSIKDLLFFLNECDDEELDDLAVELSELNYYQNVPK